MLADVCIVQLYVAGNSASWIAQRDGRSSMTIYKRLKANGVTRRSRAESNRRMDLTKAGKLYSMGLSTPQIGRVMGIHPTTVLKGLQASGFPMRTAVTGAEVAYSDEEVDRWFRPVLART